MNPGALLPVSQAVAYPIGSALEHAVNLEFAVARPAEEQGKVAVVAAANIAAPVVFRTIGLPLRPQGFGYGFDKPAKIELIVWCHASPPLSMGKNLIRGA